MSPVALVAALGTGLQACDARPHRPAHELGYYPGEVNLRRAHVVVVNQVDAAAARDIELVRKSNPKATILETACRVFVSAPQSIKGRPCWWWNRVPRPLTVNLKK